MQPVNVALAGSVTASPAVAFANLKHAVDLVIVDHVEEVLGAERVVDAAKKNESVLLFRCDSSARYEAMEAPRLLRKRTEYLGRKSRENRVWK